jgi:hypothetical protein
MKLFLLPRKYSFLNYLHDQKSFYVFDDAIRLLSDRRGRRLLVWFGAFSETLVEVLQSFIEV